MAFSLDQRLEILQGISDYIQSEDLVWLEAKNRAEDQNPWFIQPFIDLSCQNIAQKFLAPEQLQAAIKKYDIRSELATDQMLGIVMAGNIPLVGFHDFLVSFLTGIPCQVKLSSKDQALFKQIMAFCIEVYGEEMLEHVQIMERLENCTAYIATGSDSSKLYFEKYFGTKPNIIRGHRNSIAVMDGSESEEELNGLSDDIHTFFGLGCRNVTHVYCPQDYDFQPLLGSFEKYDYFRDYNKYMSNYDYQLAIHMINADRYMTRGVTILLEREAIASAISTVHYSFYEDKDRLLKQLPTEQIQCKVGHGLLPFGEAQSPGLYDFADDVDSFAFCQSLRD